MVISGQSGAPLASSESLQCRNGGAGQGWELAPQQQGAVKIAGSQQIKPKQCPTLFEE